MECQCLDKEEKRFEELAKKRLERRKDETRRIVVELISREELHEADNVADSDNANDEAVEYKVWKRRELSRIERDRGENDNDMQPFDP